MQNNNKTYQTPYTILSNSVGNEANSNVELPSGVYAFDGDKGTQTVTEPGFYLGYALYYGGNPAYEIQKIDFSSDAKLSSYLSHYVSFYARMHLNVPYSFLFFTHQLDTTSWKYVDAFSTTFIGMLGGGAEWADLSQKAVYRAATANFQLSYVLTTFITVDDYDNITVHSAFEDSDIGTHAQAGLSLQVKTQWPESEPKSTQIELTDLW